MKDIRELRGRYDVIYWPLLEARVENHRRRKSEVLRAVLSEKPAYGPVLPKQTPKDSPAKSPSDCGVAAIVSNHAIPSHVMDLMLDRMANRGMDGVGMEGGLLSASPPSLCASPLGQRHLSRGCRGRHLARDLGLHPRKIRERAREKVLAVRTEIMKEIIEKYFKGLAVDGFDGDLKRCRIPYRCNPQGEEGDFRLFGEKDPGDVFRFFVRVLQKELFHFIENDLFNDPIWPPRQIRYRDLTIKNYKENIAFLQEAEDEYIYRLARRITRENYVEHPQKKVAVLSCGKNSGCWKSDGRQLPWELRRCL